MREIVVEIEGDIGIIRINRPALHNALTPGMMVEIEEQVTRLGSQEGVSVVVITGVGDRAFSVGCDIGILRGMTKGEIGDFMRVGGFCMKAIETCPRPVIALVNGYAMGGGFELVLACDLAIAAGHALFGFPEVTLGIIPGFGGTQRLPRRVGDARAKDIIYTGRTIDASTALSWGIVNRVVPGDQLDKAAQELFRALQKADARAVHAAKRAIHDGNNAERIEFLECFIRPEVDHYMKSFLSTGK